MGYTDAQGRPEIFMHPDILAGKSTFNIVESASEDPRPRTPTTMTLLAKRKIGGHLKGDASDSHCAISVPRS